MKPAGILFDYNGVIVSDEPLQKLAMENVLKRYGVELTDEAYVEHSLGRTDRVGLENFKKVFSQLQSIPTEALAQEKITEYQHIIKNRSLVYPGIRAVLENLRKHFAVGMVTGSTRSELEFVLGKEQLLQFFEVIITAEDISQSKPNPKGYLKGIASLNLPEGKIVAIEDTSIGIRAAKGAGLKCIAVLHSRPKSELGSADLILPNVTQVRPEVVRKLIGEGE